MIADFRHILALSAISGVGPSVLRQLVAHFGTAEGALAAKPEDFAGAPAALRHLVKAVTDGRADALRRADQQIEKAERYGVRMLCYTDPEYPSRLASCPDAPVVLFVKGTVNLETAKVLSVVGTRKPTDEGRELTDSIVSELCRRHPDIIIVSGLAFGVDVAAHRAALRANRPTVGVVAHGLDVLYPSQHRDVASAMIHNGALVTEFCFGVQPESYNFVARNRVIAGLSDATLVIETGAKGGSLITTRCAFDYDRQVLAVPGFPGREQSRGCNDLIRRNVAALVESADDVDAALCWDVPAASLAQEAQPSLFAEPQGDEQLAIAEALRAEDCLSASIIGQRTRLPMAAVNVALLNMEFAGLVRSLPGNCYKLLI